MTTWLWIAQGLLALIFFMSGMMKLARPKEKLIDTMKALRPLSPAAIKTIGTLEVLGAIGVIVPVLIGVWPGVVPWAAAGLALTMIGAAVAHIRIGEWPLIVVNAALFALAAYVAAAHWS